MAEPSKNSNRFKDPTENLQAAVERLDKIARKIESQPHSPPTIEKDQSLIPHETIIQKTLTLTRRLVSLAFAREEVLKESVESENEIKGVLDTIKNNYPLIERLQKGDPKQQKIASWVFEVINRYNTSVVKAKKTPFSWDESIAAYFYQRIGVPTADKIVAPIDLPLPASLKSGFKPHSGNSRIQQAFQSQVAEQIAAFNNSSSNYLKPYQREQDAFCMKVFTWFEKEGIPRNLVNYVIKNTPIRLATEDDGLTLHLSQTIEPLPGEIYEAKGAFEKSSRISTVSHPKSGSFVVSSSSVQKGFPHPLQNNGWALCDELIPSIPHRIEMVPHLQYLLIQKKNLAVSLLPGGKRNIKAKKILVAKREAFDANLHLFRQLHTELAKALIQLKEPITKKTEIVLNNYFMSPHFKYDTLSKSYQSINDFYIVKPFIKLQDARIEQTNPSLSNVKEIVRFKAVNKILDDELKQVDKRIVEVIPDSFQSDFIQLVGGAVSQIAKQLILQENSEILEFAPPKFNAAQKSLQSALYKQMFDFIDELHSETTDIQELMIGNLEKDIKILKDFKAQEQSLVIVEELDDYYNKRYQSRG